MSQQLTFDLLWDGCDLDKLDEIMVDSTSNKLEQEDASDGFPADLFSPGAFDWENVKLEDVKLEYADFNQSFNVPNVVGTMHLESNVSSPSSSVEFTEDAEFCAGRKASTLLNSYGLDDEQLGDMTLKKLKALCHTDSDYMQLKAYRRTCLNRHYARSSRNKQQTKTTSLSTKLEESQQEVARLQQDNDMKDATIRCLQLELEILRSLKQ